MRKFTVVVLVLASVCLYSPKARAFWIWTPQSKKLVNPKYATKDTPAEQFKWAMQFYEAKDYKRAVEEFTHLVSNFTDSELAPEAQYYAGRSYEAWGKSYSAFLAYQKAIDAYPFTKRIDEIIEREYTIGNSLYAEHRGVFMGRQLMTDLDRAVEIFRKVRENAPFGEYAERAQLMIGRCYKKSEQYSEATTAFQKLVDEYPQSILADKARYEVAQCTNLSSLNPDYDQELTDEAIKEFRRISEARQGLTVSEEAQAAISILEDKKAESLFRTAKFYERQKYYKSAAMYYEDIIQGYPHSSFGGRAKERLEVVSKFVRQKEKKEKQKSADEQGEKEKKWIFF